MEKKPSEMTLEEIIIKIQNMAIASVRPGIDPHDADVVRQDILKWASFELNERIEQAVEAAAEAGGITDVMSVDHESRWLLIFGEYCTIVRGT